MAKKVFVWSSIRKLMKKQGVSIVARGAVDLLIEHLEKMAKSATESALLFREYGSQRKKISKEDLDIALKYF